MDRHYTGFMFYTDDELVVRHGSFELVIGPERIRWSFKALYDGEADRKSVV